MADSGGPTRFLWLTAPFQALRERLDTDVQLGRYLIFLAFIAATALVLPRISSTSYPYEVGQPWGESDLLAPFEYPIRKAPDVLSRQQAASRAAVPRVYLKATDAPQSVQTQLRAYFEVLESLLPTYRRVLATESLPDDSLQRFFARAATELAPLAAPPPAAWEELRVSKNVELLREQTLAATTRTYRNPFIDQDAQRLEPPIISLRRTPVQERLLQATVVHHPARVGDIVEQYAQQLAPASAALFRQLLQEVLQPNYRFDQALYDTEVARAVADVSVYEGVVPEGARIVSQGQRVTPAIARRIESLNEELFNRAGGASSALMFPGQILVVALLAFLAGQFLRKDRRIIYRNNRKTGLVFFIIFFMVAISALLHQFTSDITSGFAVNFFFLVPLSMGAIMATVFFDDRVGYFVNITVAVLVGFVVHTSYELFFIQFCAGSVAIFNLTHLRRRSQFFLTAGSLLLTYLLAYLGYNLYVRGSLLSINYLNLVLFGLNVVITLATYPLIYVVEKVFGITSDLTYIELLDTDHPVLKELSIKAPGTWQHSLQVANIAEAVATKIGANALQVRVGALFHDIGKMFQPEYYIENQSGDNPHEKLDPKVSAEVIINHVAYGEELARDHNLPKEVLDFIRTHHGTSRVEYFYRTYQRANPDCDENDFRYHGPLPTSKEMAILMVADACEAASRAMKRPTAEELKVMVDSVVSHKISDNQLVLARITFRDVYTIKAEILKILQNIYHTRIQYPESHTPAPPPAKPSPVPAVQ